MIYFNVVKSQDWTAGDRERDFEIWVSRRLEPRLESRELYVHRWVEEERKEREGRDSNLVYVANNGKGLDTF